MKKVLVTGGGGFIGSHLCERLLALGAEVVVLDDFSLGRTENLAHLNGRVRIIRDSLLNVREHAPALEGVTHVFHLAALISGYDSLNDPEPYLQTNVVGLIRLLQVCRKLPNVRIVFASSSTVYGNSDVPVRSETMAPAPMSIYALTKLTGEQVLAMYQPLYGFEHVSLRLFNVYGPRQNPDHPYANVTCKFALAAASKGNRVQLYGDGAQTRDFVYVADVVEAMVRVASPTPQRIYNVGTGRDASIVSLLQEVQSISGNELEVERRDPWPNDIRAIRADTSRLKADVGFEPGTPLREGLARTIAYFRESAARRA